MIAYKQKLKTWAPSMAMADTGACKLSSVKNFIKNTNTFEFELKDRLKWNKSQWESKGEAGSRMNKLSNSLNYWKWKLKPALENVSIIVTFFSYEKDVRLDIFSIVNAVESLDSEFKVEGLASFRNPRYLCLYFKDKETRDRVKETFKMVEDSYVVYMSWAFKENSSVHTLKVHWLALTVDLEVIKKELSKYVLCVEEQREKIYFMSGREMPIAKVAFKVKLNQGILAESIPHVMQIAGMEALITVKGRQPLCLNCEVLGHVSRDCKLRYCYECVSLQLKEHVCIQKAAATSYASVLKKNVGSTGPREPEEWGASITESGLESLETEKKLISDRIATLENAMVFANQADGGQQNAMILRSHVRRDKKRKGDGDSSDEGVYKNIDSENMEEGETEGDSEKNKCSVEIAEDSIEDWSTLDKNTNKIKKKKSKKEKEGNGNAVDNGPFPSEASQLEMSIRSYGKPIVRNAKKIKEEKKWEKIEEKREFVFKD